MIDAKITAVLLLCSISIISAASAGPLQEADLAFIKGKEAYNESRWEEAEKELSKAVSLNPEHEDAFTVLGWVQIELKKYEEAEKNLKKAVQKNPDQKD